LFNARWCAKVWLLQGASSGVRSGPLITNRACTPPSVLLLSEPVEVRNDLKRASRTGPSGVINGGSVFCAPSRFVHLSLRIRTDERKKTLALGLLPPTAGCEWQPAPLIGVEAWAEASLHRVDLLEAIQAIRKEIRCPRGLRQRSKGLTRVNGAAAHTGDRERQTELRRSSREV